MTEILKQGYLTKSPPMEEGSGTLKGWKRRWFILRSDSGRLSLQYYEDESAATCGKMPKGTILLQDCTCIQRNMKHSKYKNVFSVAVPARTYYLVAESKFDMDDWTETLCRILGFKAGQEMSLPRGTAAEALTDTRILPSDSLTFSSGAARHSTLPAGAARTAIPPTVGFPSSNRQVQTLGKSTALPQGAGVGASTLRRHATLDSAAAEPSVCFVNREVVVQVQKRFAMHNIIFAEALGGIWICGWNHNVPGLSGFFKLGDQVLRIAGLQVRSVEEAGRHIDLYQGGQDIEFLILRTPWALEIEIQRRSRSEPLGVTVKENKIVQVAHNGAAAQCGLTENAVGVTGQMVNWIVTEINGRPVSIQPKNKDEIFRLLHASGMAVTLLLHPEDFVKILFKKLKAVPHYQDFIPR